MNVFFDFFQSPFKITCYTYFMSKYEYDVIIIGAGITGASVARELSKTTARVCFLDKEDDVCCGSSKANSGIVHAGYDPVPGTLMAKYNIRGSEIFEDLSKKLNFSYQKIGSLVLAFNESGLEKIKSLYERGKKNGVKGLKIVQKDELFEMEPNLNENVIAALYAPSAAIISPYEASWAIAESAVINGATFLRNTAVHAINKNQDGFVISTTAGELKAKYLVNAAGLFADKISMMAGARAYKIIQRKGEYCLLDNKCSGLVNHVLFQTPGVYGKGVLVTKTVDGNILIGPSAEDLSREKEGYTGTTSSYQAEILNAARRSVAEIPTRNIINSFAGIRAIAVEMDGSPINDFIVEEDKNVPGFINVGGICSPGLTSAPAIGEAVVELLVKAGLKVEKNKDFIEERKGIPSFKNASLQEKTELIKKDSRYGQIICRCEMITEGEIVASIHSPIGAVDLDGVKRRTRAGMGRCQSGFCSPRVTEIISRELNIPMINVTKKGGTSYILEAKTRPDISEVAK